MKTLKRFLPTSVRNGSVLAYTLVILSVVLIAAIGIASVSVTNQQSALLSNRSVSAFQVADTGSQAAIVAIREELSSDSNAKLNDLTVGGVHCSSGSISEVPSGTVGTYTLTFEDKEENVLNCGSDLSEVAIVRSVGEYRNTSRAVKVAVVSYQLAGHWKLNESSGTDAADSSGKGNDGVWNNAIDWNGGEDAPQFDGIDDVVEVDDDPSLDLTKQVSISLWLNVGVFPASPLIWAPLVSKMDNEGTELSRTYAVWLNGSTHKIRLSSSNGSENKTLDISSTVSSDTWHHYVGVIDRVSGVMAVYFDGVEENTTSFSPADAVSNTYPVRIGGNFPPAHGVFNGMIDDVRVYNGVLSQEMVENIYTIGRQ